MANSIRKMLADGSAKRADAIQVRFEDIHVEPDFNLRDKDEEYEAYVESLATYIKNGGRYAPLEIRLRDEGGVFIVDGHSRHDAIGRALASGAPLRNPKDGQAWIHVIPFEGNDAERTMRIITSNKKNPLKPLKVAEGYKRLLAFGWTIADIAKHDVKSQEHVRQMLTLGKANSDVQQMIKSGEATTAVAVQAVRKHGDKAGKVLAEGLEKAKKAGKKKVTSLEMTDRQVIEFMQLHWFVASGTGEMEFCGPDSLGRFTSLREAVKAAAVEKEQVE